MGKLSVKHFIFIQLWGGDVWVTLVYRLKYALHFDLTFKLSGGGVFFQLRCICACQFIVGEFFGEGYIQVRFADFLTSLSSFRYLIINRDITLLYIYSLNFITFEFKEK